MSDTLNSTDFENAREFIKQYLLEAGFPETEYWNQAIEDRILELNQDGTLHHFLNTATPREDHAAFFDIHFFMEGGLHGGWLDFAKSQAPDDEAEFDIDQSMANDVSSMPPTFSVASYESVKELNRIAEEEGQSAAATDQAKNVLMDQQADKGILAIPQVFGMTLTEGDLAVLEEAGVIEKRTTSEQIVEINPDSDLPPLQGGPQGYEGYKFTEIAKERIKAFMQQRGIDIDLPYTEQWAKAQEGADRNFLVNVMPSIIAPELFETTWYNWGNGVPFREIESAKQNMALTTPQIKAIVDSAAQSGVPWQLVAQAALQKRDFFQDAPQDTSALTPEQVADNLMGGTMPIPGADPRGWTEASAYDVIKETVKQIADGAQMYAGSYELAYIHSIDPKLADKIYNDHDALTDSEVAAKNAYMDHLEVYAANNPTSDLARSVNTTGRNFNFIKGLQAGATDKTVFEDPSLKDSTRNSYKVIYESKFLREPTERELDNFIRFFVGKEAEYQKAARSWNPLKDGESPFVLTGSDGQQLRATASIDEWLKSGENPEYALLYGKKPEGVTDDQYLSSFEQQAAKLYGSAQGAQMVNLRRLGMQSGDLNVVGQQGIVSGEGYDSSAFQQRLAGFRNVFRSTT